MGGKEEGMIRKEGIRREIRDGYDKGEKEGIMRKKTRRTRCEKEKRYERGEDK